MIKKILAGIFLVLVAIAVSSYAQREPYATVEEFLEVDPVAAELTVGNWLDLPSARTHYVHFPAENSQHTGYPVVYVHGFTGSILIWEPNFSTGASTHARYAFDSIGRGLTERPRQLDYSNADYRQHVLELVNELGIDKFHIVGMSMGGAVATDFAHHYPERIASVSLVNPAGLPFDQPSIRHLATVPVIGAFLTKAVWPIVARASIGKMFAHPERVDDGFADRYHHGSTIVGYQHALRQTLKNMDLHGNRDAYIKFEETKVPTLVIWGLQDKIIPNSVLEEMQKLMPSAQYLLLGDAGHSSTFEAVDEFHYVAESFWADVDQQLYQSEVTAIRE